ncbi:hypothetical protein HDU87_008464 [Geranomyces variabilis]|uniref:N-acetyltransferase domain-containing protein n=1 Tax=Geranomyces variabilis TaxID=109894 RepID=A0AAD5TNM0_9FUNG|nr:hypothetical protein HDU87_008464 [Geranomyces variabilis]
MSDYELRALTLPEVPAFLAHCAQTFAPAGAPAALFQDHWHNDPHAQVAGVLIALDPNTTTIVSSVRVYHRSLNLAHHLQIPCGAIGDVATHPAHRGKGLARRLMALADTYMKSCGIPVAALHAAPLAAPLYEACGYVRRPMLMSVLRVAYPQDASTPAWLTWKGPAADLGYERLAALYDCFAPAGTLARDAAYWNMWVARGSRDERAQLVRRAVRGKVDVDGRGRAFEGYAFLDVKSWRLCEWFAGWVAGDDDSPNNKDTTPAATITRLPARLETEVFEYLLAACLHTAEPPIPPPPVDSTGDTFLEFKVPTALLPAMYNESSSFQVKEAPRDDCWMFKSLAPCVAKPKSNSASSAATATTTINTTQNLLAALGPDFGFCRTDAY